MEYATYSLADNRIRAYCGWLPKEDFEALRKAGFQPAPKQGYLYAAWSPYAEDALRDVLGIIEIEDEDIDAADRAAERAARFEAYSESATARADAARKRGDAIADMIPFGQPILVGHHSEKHARRDADRIWNAAAKDHEERKRAAYWTERAKAVVAHAERRERPDVVARRIKALEADLRKFQRSIGEVQHIMDNWDDVMATPKPSYPDAHILSVRHFWQRWIDHTTMRLEYERALLVEVGGLLVDKPDTPEIEVGGAVKFLGTWYTVKRVNAKSVTIIGWLDIATWEYRVPFDDITGVKSKAEWEAQNAKTTGA